MGMTIGEKILARASGNKTVYPGEIINAKIDLCMTNDATTHISIDIFEKEIKNKKIFDVSKVVFIEDHNVPSESIKTSEVQGKMRKFAKKHDVHYYEGKGVCHQIMIEDFIVPGQLIVAADSHTCSYGALGAFGTGVGSTDFTAAMNTGEIWLMVPETIKIIIEGTFNEGVYARDLILKIIGDIGANGANYKILEFSGEGTKNLTVDDRIVLCNMAVEAGAKTAIFEADDTTLNYIRERGRVSVDIFKSDDDAVYSKIIKYNLEELEPVVAKPHSVDNIVNIKECVGIKVDQCFIGSCNNGRIEELRVAAKILKNKKIKSTMKLIISPASNNVYLQAIKEGLIEIFIESGAMIANSNCSVCWGGAQGLIGSGEVLISTGTRNFKGRSGAADSFIYLASAATVAHAAIHGEIIDFER